MSGSEIRSTTPSGAAQNFFFAYSVVIAILVYGCSWYRRTYDFPLYGYGCTAVQGPRPAHGHAGHAAFASPRQSAHGSRGVSVQLDKVKNVARVSGPPEAAASAGEHL